MRRLLNKLILFDDRRTARAKRGMLVIMTNRIGERPAALALDALCADDLNAKSVNIGGLATSGIDNLHL
ncbi:hypothetical protein SDC9_143266 [bioreactor metagenome]|uniref:Uncharacterized protein n=1 Tax=bioreactor metagenome TaxID=1076179 RepID=A0A645E3J0_9ZZZZ